LAESETRTLAELLRRARHAVPLDVIGCRAYDHTTACDVARHQGRVRQSPDPNRQIESFLHQIDKPVAEDDLNLNSRVIPEVAREGCPEMQGAEAHGRCNSK